MSASPELDSRPAAAILRVAESIAALQRKPRYEAAVPADVEPVLASALSACERVLALAEADECWLPILRALLESIETLLPWPMSGTVPALPPSTVRVDRLRWLIEGVNAAVDENASEHWRLRAAILLITHEKRVNQRRLEALRSLKQELATRTLAEYARELDLPPQSSATRPRAREGSGTRRVRSSTARAGPEPPPERGGGDDRPRPDDDVAARVAAEVRAATCPRCCSRAVQERLHWACPTCEVAVYCALWERLS